MQVFPKKLRLRNIDPNIKDLEEFIRTKTGMKVIIDNEEEQ